MDRHEAHIRRRTEKNYEGVISSCLKASFISFSFSTTNIPNNEEQYNTHPPSIQNEALTFVNIYILN
jgi:hypothetical protein